MGFKDCLISAVDQGAISRQEATAMADDFEERFAQYAADMGDAAARAQARAATEAELRAIAMEKRRRANLTEASRITLKGRIQGAEGTAWNTAMGILSHYGFRDGSSVRGRSEAIMATAHAKIADTMFAFRRTLGTGRRENRALQGELVRALKGENAGQIAKDLAKSVGDVFEDLRLRFNAAGGAIPKLENWGLPHNHSRRKIKEVGRDAWKAEMRQRLDLGKIIDSLTGQPITAARLEQALDHAYSNIVSEGRAFITPQMRPTGLGAIANRRQDERFFVFKSADDWMAYHEKFGDGDVVEVIFKHVNEMSRDIAAMELLGPNPKSMVEWLKQVVAREIGRSEAGLPALAKQGMLKDSQARWAEHRIESLWQQLRGRGTVVSGAANFTGSVRNFTTGAILSMTSVLAAATDPFVAAASRRLAGLPVTSTIMDMLKMVRTQSRDDIVRSGVIWEEYLHVMGDDLRFAGPMVGSRWTQWIADRGVTWSGLKPLTTGRKLVEARAWQGHIADLAREGKRFDQLDPRFKRALEGFGVTAEDWDIWRSSVDVSGFVTPMEILRRGGDVQYLDLSKIPMTDPARLAEEKALRHRAAAEKLAEMTTSWSERSVPSGTPNARSVIGGIAQRGTLLGELGEYFLQLKSFGLSFTALQLEALGEMASVRGGGKGWRTGLSYFAALAVPLTLGGAVYNQIRTMVDGRDPEDMGKMDFWLRSTITGGGFGLFGDFVKSTENRFGQSMIEALQGPGLAFLSDSFQLARGYAGFAYENVAAAATGDASELEASQSKVARDSRKWLQRWTPFVASHPATRRAWNRIFLDNLQWATDPRADRSFKARIRQAKKDGSPYFVPPGVHTGFGGEARPMDAMRAFGAPAFDE